jgi:hypothetical protein
LNSAELNYTTHDRELLAVVSMVRKFRMFLFGLPFVAKTDHKSLEHIMDQPSLNNRQIRWIEDLQEFDFTFEYIEGVKNRFADILSRRPDYVNPKCPKCDFVATSETTTFESIKSISFSYDSLAKGQSSDEFCIMLDSWLKDSSRIPPRQRSYFKSFTKRDGIWFYKETTVVLASSSKLDYLQHFHDRDESGHFGFLKTREAILGYVYWNTMDEDITKFIASCDDCQRSKDRNSLLPGLLHSLKIPGEVCTSVGMDFGILPKSHSDLNCVLVIVDRLSKFLVAVPTKKTLSAEECASLFYKHWYLQGFGFPQEIVSDRDKLFVSKFWNRFASLCGIKLSMSTARHQQTDGISEISIKILKTALRRQCQGDDRVWPDKLPAIVFAHNNSINVTGFSPFYLHYGFSPRTLPVFHRNSNNSLNSRFKLYQKDLEEAHENLAAAQIQQSRQYDSKRKHEIFSVGDWVLLSRSGINYTPNASDSPILLQPFIGPFMISNVDLERDNYTLALPSSMRCHRIFHVRCLKKYISPYIDFPLRNIKEIVIPTIVENGAPEYEVNGILDTKMIGKTRMFLVSWVGLDHSLDSWEPLGNLENCSETLYEFLESQKGVGFHDHDLFLLHKKLDRKFGPGGVLCCLKESA